MPVSVLNNSPFFAYCSKRWAPQLKIQSTDKRENLRETLSKATEREDSIAKFNVTTGAGHSFASNGSGV